MPFKPNLLITGANGFIGGALTAKLFARGEVEDAIFLNSLIKT
jgi:nucleoside-diphosphate-sugar epimerase